MKITHSTHPGYRLNLGMTPVFKTVRIQLSFLGDLSADTVTARALVPYILKATCEKYPSRRALTTQLEQMYAASFGAGVKKIGLTQEIVFDLTILHNRYALGFDNLLQDAFELLSELLFRPRFSDVIFREEVRLLQEYFDSQYDNKMRYAIQSLYDNMYEDEPYRLQPLGQADDLASITLDDVKQAYHAMLAEDAIHINVVGDVDAAEIKDLIDTHLPFGARSKPITALDQSPKPKRANRLIAETQDVLQGKIALGFQLPVYYTTDDYYAAVVYNMLLGGGSESLLFKRIREELNLVYFIGSAYDQYKGSLMIYGGIDTAAYEEVQVEITTVMEAIATGDFDDAALAITKQVLINNLIESFDSQGAMIGRINHLSIFNKTFDTKALIARVEAIDKDDVAKIARLVQADTSFFLKGVTP